MDAVRGAVFSIALVLIATGVVLMIAPKGNIAKPLRFLCSAVVLSVVLSVFPGTIDFDFSDLQDYGGDVPTSLSEAADYGYETAAKTALRGLIRETLDELGISDAEIEISVDKSDDGSISFSSVSVLLNKQDAASVDAVYQKLSEQIGKTVSVKAREE